MLVSAAQATMTFVAGIMINFLPVSKGIALNITIVTYGSPNRDLVFGLPYAAPAYKLGLLELRKEYGYNVKHVFISQPSIQTCDDLADYSYLVARFYYSRQWDHSSLFVLTLPGCDDLVPLAQLSREWNTLILSSGVAFPLPQHQTLYPTAVSFSAINFAAWAQTFAEIFKRFRWTSVTVIYDRWGHNSVYSLLIDSIKNLLSPPTYMDFQIKTLPIDTRGVVAVAERTEALQRTKNVSRVIVLAFHADETRKFMVAASKLNMTNSEYAYFTLEPFRSVQFFGDLKAVKGDADDEVARDAFQALFQVTGACTRYGNATGLREMLNEIKRRSLDEYGIHYPPGEEPTEIVLASYYSVKFLGLMIVKALAGSLNISDGSTMARQFCNETRFIADQSVMIDYAGDRSGDICIQSYNNTLDKFQKVLYYDPTLLTLSDVVGINWRTPQNDPPLNKPFCGYDGQNPECHKDNSFNINYVVAVAVPVIIVAMGIAAVVTWKLRKEYNLKDDWWRIDKTVLVVPESANCSKSKATAFSLSTMGNDPKHIRRLNGSSVWVKKVKLMTHGNIAELIGISVDPTFLQFVYEFCAKGNLFHLLEKINLDWEFRAALMNDLIEGIIVVHSSMFGRHGYLNPYTCLIDKRFTLKISEFGLYDLTKNILAPKQEDSRHGTLSFTNIERWIPPELIYMQSQTFDIRLLASCATPEADIFALGGIMDFALEDTASSEDEGEKQPALKEMQKLISACQRNTASARPTIEEAKRRFHEKTHIKTGGFLESLIRRMQKYARKLEFAVRDRTEALNMERKLCEKLLVEMLPKIIVDKLRSGCSIQPEHFYGVSIFFSSIVGFVEFVASHTPLKVIDFLNLLFSTFDDALSMYNVYKVETVSDCYMVGHLEIVKLCRSRLQPKPISQVVSGMPIPNGNQHAAEICRMSLQLLALFKRSADQFDMQLKVGINSGSCAAGVIGSKRPRYCLFGDTVNTASRLASHGEPSKIHISTATSALILYCPEFRVIERGIVELKGKGKERTFWLEAAP